jgi:DNA mismatch endonuclease Vsr
MTYVRDNRSPIPKNEFVSKVMSSNKAKNTSPELILRKSLWNHGGKGYRIHWNVPGKPDIAYPRKKLAIFVNGCFWHRCPFCNLPLPKNNIEFWKEKFNNNIERDARKKTLLEKNGWNVMTVWECQIKNDLDDVIDLILSALKTYESLSDVSNIP